MDVPARPPSRRLEYATIAILVIGLGSAVAAYFIAANRPENPLGYDPLETKKYLHDLEMYGGKANVLAAELRDWFAGLWYGKNLAYTIAVLTLLLVGAVRLGAALGAVPIDEDETEEPANVRRLDSHAGRRPPARREKRS